MALLLEILAAAIGEPGTPRVCVATEVETRRPLDASTESFIAALSARIVHEGARVQPCLDASATWQITLRLASDLVLVTIEGNGQFAQRRVTVGPGLGRTEIAQLLALTVVEALRPLSDLFAPFEAGALAPASRPEPAAEVEAATPIEPTPSLVLGLALGAASETGRPAAAAFVAADVAYGLGALRPAARVAWRDLRGGAQHGVRVDGQQLAPGIGLVAAWEQLALGFYAVAQLTLLSVEGTQAITARPRQTFWTFGADLGLRVWLWRRPTARLGLTAGATLFPAPRQLVVRGEAVRPASYADARLGLVGELGL